MSRNLPGSENLISNTNAGQSGELEAWLTLASLCLFLSVGRVGIDECGRLKTTRTGGFFPSTVDFGGRDLGIDLITRTVDGGY